MNVRLPVLSAYHYSLIASVLLHAVLLANWQPLKPQDAIVDDGAPSLPLALHLTLNTQRAAYVAGASEKKEKPVVEEKKSFFNEQVEKGSQFTLQSKSERNSDADKKVKQRHEAVSQQAAAVKKSETVGLQETPIVKTVSYRYPPEPPVYPRLALKRGQQGEALIHARVNVEGETERLQLVRSSGYRLLDQSALKAVAAWVFMPAKRNGVAITAWIEVPVKFEIN